MDDSQFYITKHTADYQNKILRKGFISEIQKLQGKNNELRTKLSAVEQVIGKICTCHLKGELYCIHWEIEQAWEKIRSDNG